MSVMKGYICEFELTPALELPLTDEEPGAISIKRINQHPTSTGRKKKLTRGRSGRQGSVRRGARSRPRSTNRRQSQLLEGNAVTNCCCSYTVTRGWCHIWCRGCDCVANCVRNAIRTNAGKELRKRRKLSGA